jgi:hypothetical protein
VNTNTGVCATVAFIKKSYASRLPSIPVFFGAPPAMKAVQVAKRMDTFDKRMDTFDTVSPVFCSAKTKLNHSFSYY